MSRSLQMAQQDVSAAAEKLTVREESIRTLHNGNLLPSSSSAPVEAFISLSLSFCSSLFLVCDVQISENEELKSPSVRCL